MIGFESFEVKAWVDGVLTKHPKCTRMAVPRDRNSTWKTVTVVAATLFASVAVAAAANVGAPKTTTNLRGYAGAHPSSAVSNDVVPVGYWPKLLHEIKGWRSLEETAAEPPEPIV